MTTKHLYISRLVSTEIYQTSGKYFFPSLTVIRPLWFAISIVVGFVQLWLVEK
jgi:hypothetical protein